MKENPTTNVNRLFKHNYIRDMERERQAKEITGRLNVSAAGGKCETCSKATRKGFFLNCSVKRKHVNPLAYCDQWSQRGNV